MAAKYFPTQAIVAGAIATGVGMFMGQGSGLAEGLTVGLPVVAGYDLMTYLNLGSKDPKDGGLINAAVAGAGGTVLFQLLTGGSGVDSATMMTFAIMTGSVYVAQRWG